MLCCRQAMPCQPYRTTHSGGREARIHTHDRSADERIGSVEKQDENLSGQKSRRSLPAAIRIRMILTGNTDSGSFLIYCCKIANNRYIFAYNCIQNEAYDQSYFVLPLWMVPWLGRLLFVSAS